MRLNPTKVVGLFAISAVLIGAAVFVSWLLFGRSLDGDVRRMIGTMAALHTVHTKMELVDQHVASVPLFPLMTDDATIRFGADGGIDLDEKPTLHFVQNFAIQTSVNGAEMNGEYRQLANASYLLLNKAPHYSDINLSSFEKQWIAIPQTFSFGPLLGEVPLHDLTTDDLASLFSLLAKIDVVHVQKTDLVQIIDGDATLPYEFIVSKEGMIAFLSTVWEMQHATTLDTANFKKITDRVNAMTDIRGTMWIGRKTFLLHQLSLVTPNLALNVTFRDFNKPVDLSVPTSGTDIKTVLHQLGFNVSALPQSSGASISQHKETITGESALPTNAAVVGITSSNDFDNDELDNSLEFFYGTDPHNPDTDGDSVSDGEEVARGQNPLGKGSLFSFGIGQ